MKKEERKQVSSLTKSKGFADGFGGEGVARGGEVRRSRMSHTVWGAKDTRRRYGERRR